MEKKFRWNNKRDDGDCDFARMVEKWEYQGEKVFTDIYFDTHNYALTTRDIWLRQRDNSFECKVPLPSSRNNSVDRYDEIVVEEEVIGFLDRMKRRGLLSFPRVKHHTKEEEVLPRIPHDKDRELDCIPLTTVPEWLHQNTMVPFTTITTRRKKYRASERFLVDLDEMDFGYSIGEVELLVDEGEVEAAVEAVMQFCVAHGFDVSSPIRGKVLEWLYRHSPSHYTALEAAGLLDTKHAK